MKNKQKIRPVRLKKWSMKYSGRKNTREEDTQLDNEKEMDEIDDVECSEDMLDLEVPKYKDAPNVLKSLEFYCVWYGDFL